MSQGTQSTSCPACGKGLRWKAELVGRKVKCSCGEVFAMPVGPGGVGPASAAAPSAPPVAAAPKVSPFDPDTFELSDPVVGHGAAGGGKCPSCGAAMKAGAVLCVQCGFNSATKSKVGGATSAIGAASGGVATAAPPRGARLSDLAERRAKKHLLEEQPNHRFTEIYLPVVLIILGIAITFFRAYSGMGSLTAADELEEDESASARPRVREIWTENGVISLGGDDDGEMDDEEDPEIEPGKDSANGDPAKVAPKDAKQDDKDAVKDAGKTADAKDTAAPKSADAKNQKAPDAGSKDDGQVEPDDEDDEDLPPITGTRRGSFPRRPAATAPGPKSFGVSPIIVGLFSLGFQLVVMLPIVFVCTLLVAKYVDVTFGSITSVLLKLTAIVLGPMALADWIDDMLFRSTLGMGMMLGWTIRLVLVEVSLIKLFDLDFFEASVLMIVITMARFILFSLLVLAIGAMFLA